MHDIDAGKVSGQEAFSRMIALYAAKEVGTKASHDAAVKAEIATLGVSGPARVTAAQNFFKALLGPDEGMRFSERILTAADVVAVETVMKAFRGQGASFSHANRDPPEGANGKIEGYDKMSFEQVRAAQDNLRGRPAR